MGSVNDVMTTFFERDIRQQFSEFDGWNIAPINSVPSPVALYQASRNRSYHEEVAFIAVSFDHIPGNECFTALDTIPSSHGTRVKKFILTPQATDTSGVPPHVQIIPMQAFVFTDGVLVWLTKKKHARHYASAPSVPAPEPAAIMVTPTP